MHQQFKLDVTGAAGEYRAVLTYGDTVVADFDAKSVKNAQKDARTYAQDFLNENRPTRRETYTEHFTL